MSRYANWIIDIPQDEERNKYLIPTIRGVLAMCRDNSKRIQQAGCSALSTFLEEDGRLLLPHLQEIVATLAYCFDKYQRKNMLLLYDAMGTLADGVRRHLDTPEYAQLLVPRLMRQWNSYSDESPDLEPLMECLSSAVTAMPNSFASVLPEFWNRCLQIISVCVTADVAHRADPANNPVAENGLLIAAMDLISGICQGLRQACEPLLVNSNPPLLPMLLNAMMVCAFRVFSCIIII